MSCELAMELEHEGEAGAPRGEDLFYATSLPNCFDPVHAAAQRLGVTSVFAFSRGLDETRRAAETAVYGKPLGELDEGDPEPSDQTEAEVQRLYYGSGSWFEPAEGIHTAEALIAHFRDHPEEIAPCPRRADVVPDLKRLLEALREADDLGRRFRLHYSA